MKLCEAPPMPLRFLPIARHSVTPLVGGRFVRQQGQTQGISVTDPGLNCSDCSKVVGGEA